ncbi:MAG: acetoacetate decarboxylase family protein [Actinomycetota bacterium]|nr:acetoacetate decarboxylase family protein [Actinomycetota bacterium]
MSQNRWVVTPEHYTEAERRYRDPADSGMVAQSVQVFYETDPAQHKATIPPPLEAHEIPEVWVSIGWMPLISLGVAQVALRCRLAGEEGWYCLHLPMTTEAAVVGGRERFGENKKIADIRFANDDGTISAGVTRYGTTYLEVEGTEVEELAPPAEEVVPHFYFKYSLAADGQGYDHEPVLIRSVHTRKPKLLRRLEATLTLRDSDTDPVADLPVVRQTAAFYTERTAYIRAARADVEVDPAAFLPYVYQRYDYAGQG